MATIKGRAGWFLMNRLWREDPDHFYHKPEQVMRQEWSQGCSRKRIAPGHPFYRSASDRAVLLDFGCGTAEVARNDWIDLYRPTLLQDLEGPNLRYLRHKYKGYPVWVHNEEWPIVDRYDRLQCLDVLEHVAYPMALWEHLWDRLKPGGQAAVWFDNGYPHAGHLRESIAQRPLYFQFIQKHARILSQQSFDWLEKPRRWWSVLRKFCS